MATSLQSKIEWVEAIQKVLTDHTSPKVKSEERLVRDRVIGSPSMCGGRELKAVSIVPISTPTPDRSRLQEGGGGGGVGAVAEVSGDEQLGTGSGQEGEEIGMELSIRSSMMESSDSGSSPEDSDSSYI